MAKMTREEFRTRFKTYMTERRKKFTDGSSVGKYADVTADAYYDDDFQRPFGPEACAQSDMDCWEE